MKPPEPLTEPNAREASLSEMKHDPLHLLSVLIAKQPFFAGLSAPKLQLLASSAVVIEFEPDRYVFRQGAPANRFYLILEGKVELEMESATSDERMIAIRTLSSGDDLGWDWLFPPFYFHASARVAEPTKTIAFFGTRLQQQCEKDHDLGYEIMKRIAAVMVKSFGSIQQRLVECNGIKVRI